MDLKVFQQSRKYILITETTEHYKYKNKSGEQVFQTEGPVRIKTGNSEIVCQYVRLQMSNMTKI